MVDLTLGLLRCPPHTHTTLPLDLFSIYFYSILVEPALCMREVRTLSEASHCEMATIALALLLNVRGGLDLWICPEMHVLKVEAGPRWRFVVALVVV